MKTTTLLRGMICLCLFLFLSCHGKVSAFIPTEQTVLVPIAGNTYVTQVPGQAKVSPRGIDSWTGPDAVLSSFIKVSQPGDLSIAMKVKPVNGTAVFRIRVAGNDFRVTADQPEEAVYPVGKVQIDRPGYIRIDMQGITKKGDQFPKITEWLLEGEAATEPLWFVRDFETYWGMRGPSVHLSYSMPEEEVEYFYNEVLVPEGEDVIGSYFMTNGFGEGYCGIQVNSATERRILFSVWSPFETDNPKDIPEEDRIRLLAKGEGVHTGEFGNEGSGGQSYLIYPWKAGQTYRILTRVAPDGKGNTQYYAWFYEPEQQEWKLIAGFSRPKTDTWYKRPHSFLENFIPSQGYLTRKVQFGNQWVCTVNGEWIEMTEARFTYDNTAAANVRMDYAGGVEKDSFFLQNCGFFNENTAYRTVFTRPARAVPPVIEGVLR